MARTFDGTDDVLLVSPQGYASWANGLTAAGIFYHTTTVGAPVAARVLYFNGGTGGTTADGNLVLSTIGASGFGISDNSAYATIGGDDCWTSGGLPTNQWVFMAFTKAGGGDNTVRFHYYGFTDGTWTHVDAANGDTTRPDPDTAAQTREQFGTDPPNTGFLNDALAVVGIFNRNYTDQQVESLRNGLGAWITPDTQRLWVFDQAATTTTVRDMMGSGANESSLTGTTVSTRSVPWFSWDSRPTFVQKIGATNASPAAATVAVVVATPAPTITASGNPAPSTVAVTVAVPTPTINIAATPSTVATVVAVPAPTVTASGSPAPSAVAVLVAVPTPTITASGNPEPATVAVLVAVPTPTIDGASNANPAPSTVAVVAALPAPTITASGNPTPSTVAAITAVPAPTVTATGDAPGTAVAVVVAVNAPTVTASGNPTPSTAAVTVAVLAPTITADTSPTPSTVAVLVALPAPAITTSGNTAVQMATVAVVVAIAAATVSTGADLHPVRLRHREAPHLTHIEARRLRGRDAWIVNRETP